MERLFPKVVNLFSWWIDAQQLVVSLDMTVYPPGTSPRPSLADTLIALGHATVRAGGMTRHANRHSSAKDAVRALAVMVGVGRMIGAGEVFNFEERAARLHAASPRTDGEAGRPYGNAAVCRVAAGKRGLHHRRTIRDLQSCCGRPNDEGSVC